MHDLHARFHLSRRLIGDFVVVDTVHSGLQDVLFVIDLEDFDSGTQLLGCFSDFCTLPPDSLRSGTLIREILIFWGVNTPSCRGGRGVEEADPGDPEQERIQGDAEVPLLSVFLEDRFLGRFEDAVEPSEDREGQDDPPVFRLLVVAPQEVGDGPNEGSLLVHSRDVLFPVPSSRGGQRDPGASTPGLPRRSTRQPDPLVAPYPELDAD